MKPSLRPYQVQTLEAIRESYLKGIRQQLVLAATGTGKTVTFSQIPSYMSDLLKGQTLVLAHRTELLDQAIDKIRIANPKLKVAKEMASDYADIDSDVIVASVASLGRKGTERIKRFDWSKISTVITDEAHHGTGDSYNNIYELANVLRTDSKNLHVGFTATGQRADGTAMAKVFKKIVYEYPLRRAIEEGYLVDLKGIRVKTDTSLEGVKVSGGDYNAEELADRIDNPTRNQSIVKAWLSNAKGLSTVAFTANIKHAEHLSEMFEHYGVKAAAIWGDDPDRAKKLAMFHAGEIEVLCNCAVLTEGWDEPRVQCVILARPSRSGVFFAQAIGRSTRLYAGKQYSLIIDVVDISAGLSLLTLPTLMGMSTNLDLKGHSVWETVKRLEEAAKEYPQIDFTKLVDIDSLETYIQEVNLFTVTFPPEVEENSDFSWFTGPTGDYILTLPKDEKLQEAEKYVPRNKKTPADRVTISVDILDKWTVRGTIKGKKYKAERPTIEEAFKAADWLLEEHASEALKLIRREEKWHKEQPSEKQLKLLKKLYKGKVFPLDMSKGEASHLITKALSK